MTGFDLPRSTDEESALTQRCEVYVEVGTQPAQLVPVRVVAAALAARADFDLDAVADLRMAVDEACSTLAMPAPPDAQLRCLLEVDPDRITVTVRVSVPVSVTPLSQDTLGWRILRTLTDEVELLGEDGYFPGIRLVKLRRMERA